MTFLRKISLLDAVGWLSVFLAGLGLIFPFSFLAPANLIFISLALLYLALFFTVEFRLLADPSALKKLRQNFIPASKATDISIQKFARVKSKNEFIEVENNGITFNAQGRSEFIPWAEVIFLQRVKTVSGTVFKLYTPTRRFVFDSNFQNASDLVQIIDSAIETPAKF